MRAESFLPNDNPTGRFDAAARLHVRVDLEDRLAALENSLRRPAAATKIAIALYAPHRALHRLPSVNRGRFSCM